MCLGEDVKVKNMYRTEKSQETNEGASIGIGAMIVFIALILVAAVASAVIIQTAEKLQQTAQQTGKDTASEQGTKVVLLGAVISGGSAAILTFELGAGSETTAETAIAWSIMCDDGAGDIAVDDANFALATNLGGTGTPATFSPGTAYELPITAANCGAWTAQTQYHLVLAVNGGGITTEILSAGLSVIAGKGLV
jgi:hypothetical protein